MKEQKAKEKLAHKLAKMSKEKLEAYNAKQKAKQEKDEAHWLKEKEKGDAFYAGMQAELTK